MKSSFTLSSSRSGKGKLIVLAVACLAGLLIASVSLFWPGKQDSRDAYAQGSASLDPVAAAFREEPLGASSPGSQASTQAPESENRIAMDGSPLEVDQRLGTLVIQYSEGGQELEASGELLLCPMDGESEGAAVLVPFDGGRFALEGLPEGLIRIGGATSFTQAGERSVAFRASHFVLKQGEAVNLQGHYNLDCKLHVVDADSGAELDGIRVLPKLPKHAGPPQSHPGAFLPFEQSIENGSSPAVLPWKPGVQSYWVSAKGYAWSLIQIDHESGGDRYARLEPAGGLVVRVSGLDSVQVDGPDLALALHVRVYHADTLQLASAYRLGEEGGRRGIHGLPLGAYIARAEVGALPEHPVVLGETPVEIQAFETTSVQINVEGARIPPPVSVRGKLVLPLEAQRLELSLSIRPAAGPVLRPGDQKLISHASMKGGWDTEERRWNANHLTPGRYLFVVEPMQHSVLVDVPETPLDDVTIVVPKLFPITLHAIDSSTRESIPAASFRWARAESSQSAADQWTKVNSIPAQGSETIWLPEGPFTFSASSPIHGERSLSAMAGSSTQDFSIELCAYIPREVVLRDGDTVIPWPSEMNSDFSVVGSSESHPFERLENGKRRACFALPGLHELKVGPIEGFLKPDPLVVSVDESDNSPIFIQLTR